MSTGRRGGREGQGQEGGAAGYDLDGDDVVSVDMSVQTDESSETGRRRGRQRWRRGGLREEYA